MRAHNDPGSFHYTYQIEQFFKPTSSWKTVRIFAYSSMREQSNKGSGTRLKTESETGEDLRNALPFSLLILRKKPTALQSNQHHGINTTNVERLLPGLQIP